MSYKRHVEKKKDNKETFKINYKKTQGHIVFISNSKETEFFIPSLTYERMIWCMEFKIMIDFLVYFYNCKVNSDF